MRRPFLFLPVVALGLSASARPVAAADVSSSPDPAPLTAAIDRHIVDGLSARGVRPAPPADDATFFRRVNVALAGRIPLPAEVRAFLADSDPDKRRKAVEKLLANPAYANHFTTLWRGWLIPEAITDNNIATQVPGFEAWLRPQIAGNVPFNKIVEDLLTYPLNPRTAISRNAPPPADGGTNPVAFYVAKDAKPENLAAATARVFLGVQLECAQCHDHPFAKWSREQFWGLAAFYGGVERPGGPNPNGVIREVFDRRELPIPNTDPVRIAAPTFLDDTEPQWRFKSSGRITLAKWVTAKDNPFFARAMANRLWGYLFGVGIVDPVDDFNEKNPPSHPELLDELARAFASSGFDVKYLLKAMVLSEAYQRDSTATDKGQQDVRSYARFPVQGLTPEQLFDSLAVVVGARSEGPGGAYLQNPGSGRRQFLEKFNPTGKKTETETTIIQALTLMNGGMVAEATNMQSSRTLGAIVELPGLTPEERIDAIYLAVLSRLAKPEEKAVAIRHVGAKSEKYADVMWALLNGIEFRTNH
jgi:hypothetical protein